MALERSSKLTETSFARACCCAFLPAHVGQDDCEPRIADLGEARVLADNHAMTMVGTPAYTAPEVLRGEHYDTSADVFSFAIVMCELLT